MNVLNVSPPKGRFCKRLVSVAAIWNQDYPLT